MAMPGTSPQVTPSGKVPQLGDEAIRPSFALRATEGSLMTGGRDNGEQMRTIPAGGEELPHGLHHGLDRPS